MQVFYHLLYEFDKGLRDLALITEPKEKQSNILKRLQKENIPYLIQDVDTDKINVFFGKKACVDVVSTFINTRLNYISAEQDFILGIMLGYNRERQCERYLVRKDMYAA